MRRIGYVMLAFLLAGMVAAEVQATGRIIGVTLFPATATVMREATVQLEAGDRMVRFGGLPRRLVADSAMARGSGLDGIMVLDTRIKREYADAVKSDAEKRLDAAIKRLKEEKKMLRMRQKLLKQQKSFLERLQISSVKDINRKIKVRTITTDEWDKLYRYIFSKVTVVMKEQLQLSKKMRLLKKEQDSLQKKLDNLDSRVRKSETVARVSVRVKRSGRYRIRLEYRVRRAGWRPGYEVRLTKDGKSAEVTYFASIRQRTGEDWSGIKLELATAAAGRWKRLPKQRPWYLYPGRRRRSRRYPRGGAKNKRMRKAEDRATSPPAASTDGTGDYDSVARSRVISGGASVRFAVHGRASVPSGRSVVRRVLQVQSLPVELVYKAFPNYAAKIFAEGIVKNNSKLHFLPGRARVFRDGVQIGRTSLTSVAPGGSFRLFFGNDPGVESKKERVERKVDPGSDNEVFYTYRLTVHNNSDTKRVVTLFDALPVSTNTDIEVDIKEMSHKPDSKSKRGIYKWKLSLAPGEKKIITYRLKIEYPSKKGIRGLR